MKRTTILLAATILTFALLASPRGAMSGSLVDSVGQGIKDLSIKDVTEDPCPEDSLNIFKTLVPITGKIAAYAASHIGGYACKDGSIEFAVGFGGTTLVQSKEVVERTICVDILSRGAPVKVTLLDGKQILILGLDLARFNAVLAILHHAKLTNKTLNFQAAAVPGCANAFFAAEVVMP